MLIKKSKKSYLRKFFQENFNNSRKTWNKINEILNRKRNQMTAIFLSDDGVMITNQKAISNRFNNYYINVAQNLIKEMGETNTEFQDYLKNPNEHSFFINETTPDEIDKYLKKLDIKKASDLYGISPFLVKTSSEKIKNQLSIIFNLSFVQGIVPNKLKIGVIYPIHKGDTKFICSNYRPISTLPIFSKILEKLMHKRLTSFLEKYEILFKHQYGFQKGKSTEHAIIDLHSNIIKPIEKKEKACAIFLDFVKAFDTVNHKILLKKIEYIGIRDIQLQWFDSNLSNRQQCVKLGQDISDFKTVKCGVPQGSVLRPLFFLIFINDIYISTSKVSFYLFADGTCLFYSNKDYKKVEKDINNALENITNWLKANKLTLNVKKSNLILFNIQTNIKDNPKIKICIGNSELEQKNSSKYLGIYFDKRLSWDTHIDYINNEINRGIGIIKKIRYFVKKNTLKNIYYSFVKPHIDYGTLAWGTFTNIHLETLNKSIKRSIRAILFKGKYDSVKPYYKYLQILPFLDNIKLLRGKFMWNLTNHKLPTSIIEQFPLKYNQAINSQKDKLIIPYFRTSIGKRSLSYSSLHLWNYEIPSNIKCKESSKSFSKAYEGYLLDRSGK